MAGLVAQVRPRGDRELAFVVFGWGGALLPLRARDLVGEGCSFGDGALGWEGAACCLGGGVGIRAEGRPRAGLAALEDSPLREVEGEGASGLLAHGGGGARPVAAASAARSLREAAISSQLSSSQRSCRLSR